MIRGKIKTNFCFFLAIIITYSSLAATTPATLIDQHRWSVGGVASLAFSINHRLRTDLNAELISKASYFIFNHLEMALSFTVKGIVATSDKEGRSHPPIQWGAGMGARYYFDAGRKLYPYVGLLGDFEITNNWGKTFIYNFGVEGGLLIAITDALAVDIMFPMKGQFAGASFQQVIIAPTCLGLRYFF
jgi:hypothetical protein